MKKKTKIILIISVTIVAAAIAGLIYQGNPPDTSNLAAIEDKEETAEPEVVIDINTEKTDIPEYKEIVDEETGETVIAEVQVNELTEKKNTIPPEKPKAEDSYTNPQQPPAYTKEQTVIEEKPKTSTSSNQNQSAGSVKVYIDGFGYVEKAGQTRTQTGVSDGDINKMVGSMD